MSDRFNRGDDDTVRDNAGHVYDIKDGHAEEEIPNPRDSIGMEPAAGYMGGGAGGIATSGFDTAVGGDENELRATSESGPHGAVAEAADLGQRPLRDYKRDADASVDSTDTTVLARESSTGPVDSYVSDEDTIGRPGDASSRSGSTVTTATAGAGTTIVDTARERTGNSATTIRQDAGNDFQGSVGQSDATLGSSAASTTSAATARSADPGHGSISASTDNTSPLGDVSSTETLTNVQEGYKVVDVNGDEIGKVRSLKSGDTSSSTVDDAGDMSENVGVIAVPGGTGTGGSTGIGAGAGIPGILGTTADGGSEPNVSEPAYSRLTRVGFIKIDSKGLFAKDRYAGADQIDRVDGDTVYLSVGKDELIS